MKENIKEYIKNNANAFAVAMWDITKEKKKHPILWRLFSVVRLRCYVSQSLLTCIQAMQVKIWTIKDKSCVACPKRVILKKNILLFVKLLVCIHITLL